MEPEAVAGGIGQVARAVTAPGSDVTPPPYDQHMMIGNGHDDGSRAPAMTDPLELVDVMWEMPDEQIDWSDWQPPFDLYAPDARDPIDRVVADLGLVDRAMARVLRQMAEAGPRDGLSVRRQVGLLAGATGLDVGFLDRAVQVLSAMPLTQRAFDDAALSWSQVRGIVMEARRLSVAQRQVLDAALADTVAKGRLRGEPDRVVETAGDLAAKLDVTHAERAEAAEERQQRLVLQPDFDGWGTIHGTLCPEVYAVTQSALDLVADDPVAADAPPPTDDDGTPLPKAARPNTSRGAQLAEALGRMATMILGGTDREGRWQRARPRATIIASLADLLPDDDADADPTGSLTARLLLRRGNGRRRITRALTRTLSDDADLVALFTDDNGMPAAMGDSHHPITLAMRRAVTARDQGCRAPGCRTPASHCDVHHVIPRHRGGATEVSNLALLCRPCHVRLDRHRWHMWLDPDDATLRVHIGRHTYLTRPRLHGPPLPCHPRPDPPPGAPAGTATGRPTAHARRPSGSDSPVPF